MQTCKSCVGNDAQSELTKTNCLRTQTAKTQTIPDVKRVKENMMNRDHLTYRYPRTMNEAFPCDARSAHAIERTRRPSGERVVDTIGGVVIGLIFTGLFLAYFDVLVK